MAKPFHLCTGFCGAGRAPGALMAELRAAGKLDKGGRPAKNRGFQNPGLPTLADQGIDKNLAKDARKFEARFKPQPSLLMLRRPFAGHALSLSDLVGGP